MPDRNTEFNILLIITTIVLLCQVCFIVAILFLYQKKNMLFGKQLEDIRNNYDHDLLQSQLEIQELTFQDISREIHDNIGLSLSLAKLQLNTIHDSSQPGLVETIGSSVDLISKAIIDLSDISKSFSSETIRNQGLYNMLKTECEKINRSRKLRAEFSEEGNIVFLDAKKELILFRIAQEALNNVLKHAEATCVTIKLVYTYSHLLLTIEDDGRGFDRQETEQYQAGRMNAGLSNIQTRVKSLNGTCHITSIPGLGTRVGVNAPY